MGRWQILAALVAAAWLVWIEFKRARVQAAEQAVGETRVDARAQLIVLGMSPHIVAVLNTFGVQKALAAIERSPDGNKDLIGQESFCFQMQEQANTSARGGAGGRAGITESQRQLYERWNCPSFVGELPSAQRAVLRPSEGTPIQGTVEGNTIIARGPRS